MVSGGDSRLTYLHADLTQDSLFTLDGHVFGRLIAFEDDILFTGFTPENTAEPVGGPPRQVGILHRLADGQVVWSSWTTPARDKPYWNAMGGLATDAAGDSLFIMASLLYPATILNGTGEFGRSHWPTVSLLPANPRNPRWLFRVSGGRKPRRESDAKTAGELRSGFTNRRSRRRLHGVHAGPSRSGQAAAVSSGRSIPPWKPTTDTPEPSSSRTWRCRKGARSSAVAGISTSSSIPTSRRGGWRSTGW